MAKLLEQTIEFINNTGGEFTQQAIAERIGVSQGTVSLACKHLLDKGVLSYRNRGRTKIYFHGKLGEVHVTEPESKEAVSQLIPVAEQFEMIEHITGMVLDGIAPSLLLTGMAGVGKTYTVRQEIIARGLKKDIDYQWVSGMASPLGLFRVLHDNRDGLVVFDDCDAVLQVKNSLSILKSALDLYKTRVISWPSKTVSDAGMDEHFEFTGQVIFISNLDFAKIADALTSRAFKVDVFLTPEQVIEKIGMIISDITPNGVSMSLEYKQDALDAMNELKDDIIAMGKNIDLRAFEKACLLRKSVGDNGRWNDVKKMIIYQI